MSWFAGCLGRRPKPAPAVERRVTPRRRMRFPIEVQGPSGRFSATVIDFHDQGVMLVSKQAWATGTVLFLDFRSFWLMGFARVRHCTLRDDWTYAIGLEFCAPLMRQEFGTWHIERISYPADPDLADDQPELPGADDRTFATA
ncbi:MAG TPA: PilZ domain-containing protein [Bryobacteraceae bacterium]|nr:PilZ domain-containing protein [Bryobacteraceae bacterium]